MANNSLKEGVRGVYSIPEPKQIQKKGKTRYFIHNYFYYDENGKRVFNDTSIFDTPEEAFNQAKSILSKKIGLFITHDTSESTSETIGELLDEFLLSLEEMSLSEITAGTKSSNIDKTKSVIRITKKTPTYKKKLSDFDADEIDLWLNSLKIAKYKKTIKGEEVVKKYSPKSYTEFKRVIRSFFKWLKTNNKFYKAQSRYDSIILALNQNENPKKQEKTESEKQENFRYLDYDEFINFSYKCLYEDISNGNKELTRMLGEDLDLNIVHLDYTNYQRYKYFVFFSCLFYMGLRTEEAIPLLVSDVFLSDGKREGRVDIIKAFTGHHRKADRVEYLKKKNLKNKYSGRRMPVHPRLNKILADYIEYMKENKLLNNKGILFPGDDGMYLSYTSIDRRITKIKTLMKYKKPFSKHDFRRSCAMWLCYNKQMPLQKAYRFFGHKDSEMLVEVYTYRMRLEEEKMLKKDLEALNFFNSDEDYTFNVDGSKVLIKPSTERLLNENDTELHQYYKKKRTNNRLKTK